MNDIENRTVAIMNKLGKLIQMAQRRSGAPNNIMADMQTMTIRSQENIFGFIRRDNDTTPFMLESAVGSDIIHIQDIRRMDRITELEDRPEHFCIHAGEDTFTFYPMPASNFKFKLPSVPDELPIVKDERTDYILNLWAIMKKTNRYEIGDLIPFDEVFGWRSDSEEIRDTLMSSGILDRNMTFIPPYREDLTELCKEHEFGEEVNISDRNLLDSLFYSGYIYEIGKGTYGYALGDY